MLFYYGSKRSFVNLIKKHFYINIWLSYLESLSFSYPVSKIRKTADQERVIELFSESGSKYNFVGFVTIQVLRKCNKLLK